MRVAASWHDACLLNISSRGLMAQAASAPLRGTYVELRSGSHVIVGRVAWSKGHRFGLRTQEPIVAAILLQAAAETSSPPAVPFAGHPVAVERRQSVREFAWQAERSRWWGKAAEFVCVLCAAIAAGAAIFGSVEQVLASPLASAQLSLDRATGR